MTRLTPRTQALVAGGAAVACIAAWAMGLFLPWQDTGTLMVTRADLADGIGYERDWVLWPAVALPIAAVALGTAAWAAVAKVPVGPRVRQTALLAALAAATVAGVAGLRLLGFQVARALDPGDPVIIVLAPAYATVAAAVLAAGAALAMGLARPAPGPWPGKAAVVSTGTLASLPFIPFAVAEGDFALHYDEWLLAVAASEGTGGLADAGQALGWTRGLLWAAAAISLALALAAVWARPAWLRRWGPLVAVPVLAGATTMAATFQWRLWNVDGLRHGWNFIALAGAAVALALQTSECAVAWRDPERAAAKPVARKA